MSVMIAGAVSVILDGVSRAMASSAIEELRSVST